MPKYYEYGETKRNGVKPLTWTKKGLGKIHELYVVQEKPLRKVASFFGVSHGLVQRAVDSKGWMRAKTAKDTVLKNKKKIKRMYVQDLCTCQEIADELSTNVSAIEKFVSEQPYKRTLSETFKQITVVKGRHRSKVLNAQSISNYVDNFRLVGIDRESYELAARKLTNSIMVGYGKYVDPKKLRSTKHHVDHQFSVQSGYYKWSKTKQTYVPRLIPVPLYILCHPANLKILKSKDNTIKGSSNHLSLKKLCVEIDKFEKKNGPVFNTSLVIPQEVYSVKEN